MVVTGDCDSDGGLSVVVGGLSMVVMGVYL